MATMQYYPHQQPVQTVRTYRSSRQMERDQRQMNARGWAIINTVHNQPRASLLRLILIGWLFRPKPEIIVTYQRALAHIPVPAPAPVRAPVPAQHRMPTFQDALAEAKRKRKERFGF
jgi:hypothetical protein